MPKPSCRKLHNQLTAAEKAPNISLLHSNLQMMNGLNMGRQYWELGCDTLWLRKTCRTSGKAQAALKDIYDPQKMVWLLSFVSESLDNDNACPGALQ